MRDTRNLIMAEIDKAPPLEGCRLTNTELAALTGVSYRTITRVLSQMRAQGDIGTLFDAATGARLLFLLTAPEVK